MEDETKKEIDVTLYDEKEAIQAGAGELTVKEDEDNEDPYNSSIGGMIELEDVTEAEPENVGKTIADNIGALCVTMIQIRDHLENIAELMLRQTGK